MRINNRWSIHREPHGLRLDEKYMSKDKDGNPVERVRSTWHATAAQCGRKIFDAEIAEAPEASARAFSECTLVAMKAIDHFAKQLGL